MATRKTDINLFALAASIPSQEDKTANYGTGGSHIQDSLSHASSLYAKGYVDDSNREALALILAVLAKHGDKVVDWIRGAHATMADASAGGIDVVNSITMSPFPSFETQEELDSYLNEMQAAADALHVGFSIAPRG